jgi:hypothetical protein
MNGRSEERPERVDSAIDFGPCVGFEPIGDVEEDKLSLRAAAAKEVGLGFKFKTPLLLCAVRSIPRP